MQACGLSTTYDSPIVLHGQALMQLPGWCAGSSWGWRWPFVLVALPALGVAAIMLVTTREPPRGGTEAALSVRSRRSTAVGADCG